MIRWQPINRPAPWNTGIDRLFNEFMGRSLRQMEEETAACAWTPAVNILEREDGIVIPGRGGRGRDLPPRRAVLRQLRAELFDSQLGRSEEDRSSFLQRRDDHHAAQARGVETAFGQGQGDHRLIRPN